MSATKTLALSILLIASGTTVSAAEGHGILPKAEALFHLGPLPVTNSMVTSWVVAVALILIVRLMVGRVKLVPGRGQAIIENLVQGLFNMLAPIVGPKVARPAFPLLIGLFVFILIQNWSGLLPGVGSLKIMEDGHWGDLIRPGNADMNGTIGLALVAMVAWVYFILKYAGVKFILHDWFGNKADKKEIPALIYYFLFLIFFGVGLIEIISIVFRPVSLSFRLFGNIFGGENLLHAMFGMFKWGLPVPFYLLELLIGIVQALVFTLLIAVYIGLICNHDEGHEHDTGHGNAEGKAAH
ncbi:F0F1 ATP synthase subunit A [Geminisphaera colitermitum]|uniref:F0F1 ATP synthase subunit A n=1 Tax=Geminisphaera colitermitum TaxID=1148786 RepID=UPI000158CDE5|nr:F0F1 ATP synthase subunit A [Geminisphaera colitermitum]